MANALRRCPICKSETAPSALAAVSGEEAAVALTVKGLPVLECTQGHRSFPHPDFPLLLLDHLLEQDAPALPASKAEGLLFKHYRCAGCGAELGKDTAAHTFRVDIALADLPPFEVDLTVPAHRCGQCGREQLHSLKDVRSNTPAALAHAFKAAQLAAR